MKGKMKLGKFDYSEIEFDYLAISMTELDNVSVCFGHTGVIT
jgi:hypothetical protein